MIVAEIGLNHFGSTKVANQYINKLIKSDIDAITFQIPNREFYRKNKKLKLPNNFYLSAIKKVHSKKKKIGLALGDYHDFKKYKKYNYDFIKLLSFATKKMATDNKLAFKLGGIRKSIFLSIGMVNYKEINKILKNIPRQNISLLYTSFSKKINDLNLGVIKKLKQKFHLPIAYGQHANSTKILYMAKSMGYRDIFFYVKRNINKIHLDEKHAIKLSNLNKVIKNLKNANK